MNWIMESKLKQVYLIFNSTSDIASYASKVEISLVTSLNSFGATDLSRRHPSLCRTNGCVHIWYRKSRYLAVQEHPTYDRFQNATELPSRLSPFKQGINSVVKTIRGVFAPFRFIQKILFSDLIEMLCRSTGTATHLKPCPIENKRHNHFY